MGMLQEEPVCRSCHQSFRNHSNLKVHTRNALRGKLKRCDGKKRPVHKSRKSDQYNTPEWMWRDLVIAYPALVTTKVWDPFFNDGQSTGLMRSSGMKKVKAQTRDDFFKVFDQHANHLIVANPPFSLKQRIIRKLVDTDRPFILLLPIAVMYVGYFKPVLKQCKVIVPHKQCVFGNARMKKTITVPSAFFCYKTGPNALITYCQ